MLCKSDSVSANRPYSATGLMTKNPIIKITHLTKTFRAVTAVDDVTLTVNEGDVYGILGPNGAGKTTTISLILALTKATRGEIEVLGKPVTPNNNSILKNVGSLVGDIPAYVPYLTGRQNLLYAARMLGVREQRVDEVLELMDLASAADRKPNLYSTGMKQRLGMGMAIIHHPKLLILDEPTNGMDPAGIKEVRLLVQHLANKGITILLCSHLLHEVEQVCNRVAIFNKGRVIAEGSIGELSRGANTVYITTDHRDATVRLLEDIPGVTIRLSESPAIGVTGIDSRTLIKTLVKHDLTPAEVYRKDNNLEELFLDLISKEG